MADSKKPTASRPKIKIGTKTVKINTEPLQPTVRETVLPEPLPVPEPEPKKTTVKRAEPEPEPEPEPERMPEPSRRPESGRVEPTRRPESMRGAEPRRADSAKKHGERDLHELYKLYLHNVTKVSPDEELELEVKFGTMGVKSITRIKYDTILKKLLSSGFYVDSTVYLLRIQNEYMDPRTGAPRLSEVRTEISGLQNIRKYCQSNTLDTIDAGISYIDKTRFKSEQPTSVDVPDFNFRVSLSKEMKLDKNAPIVRGTLDKWNDRKKTFRYLNRCKLRHPTLPVVVDLSIVKDSKRQGRHYIPEYNIHDSGVFTAAEKYEVEIECLNSLVGLGTAFHTAELLNAQVFKPVIKYILAGLQETNYPVSYPEQTAIVQDYGKLIWGKEYEKNRDNIDFIGPSSFTLELKNIRPANPDVNVPNIRENYTVTDKADGERKLLFIAPNGKIYLINNNLDVQFTGNIAKNRDIWNTLIDGEHILLDKKKKFINLYAAFDIYYIGGEDIRSKGFMPQSADDISTNFRLLLLNMVIEKINAVSIVNESAPLPLKITKKRFYLGTATQSIFQGCKYILDKEQDGLFEYETDGLIFTPANMGVASNKIGEYVDPIKISWKYSFKWKPAAYNTIDFMVSVKKNESGTDIVSSTFSDGLDLAATSQIAEYKTVVLRVGFDERKHGYINPYQETINDHLPHYENYEDRRKNKYIPAQFYPTEPSDYNAGICQIPLTGSDKKMYTENDEVIEDNMIVEFRYDMTKDGPWRWIPLRVRYDKTAQLRAEERQFGNAFHVANNIWHTIYHPVTPLMMKTGEDIPGEVGDDDVYYNKGALSATRTQALRNFHNLYVKSLLIKSVAKPGDTLIDLAVGKGGDWPKWIDAKLRFVFGVDVARDNIQNRFDGAYARYLTNKKQHRVMPAALFVNGNSSVNIKKTTGILVDKDKQITRAVFGQGPKDAKLLGEGVYKQYGVASEGFDVCSIQFAIHYMFENQETLQNFLQNVSEVTKEGGYFIGTSYDGEKLFNMLKKLPKNESKVIMDIDEKTGDRKKIWELTKRYDQTEFNDDESCVGYQVDVFQESINKTFPEYLVNYTYLTRILENYGFVLASVEDLKNLHAKFSAATGFFSDLFQKMQDEIKDNPQAERKYEKAASMTDGERTISFLNRYFIYKKVRKVSDAEKVSMNLQHKTVTEVRDEARGSLTAKQAVKEALSQEPAAPASKKPRPTLKLNKTKAPLSTIVESVAPLSTIMESAPPEPAAPAAPAPAAPAPAAPAGVKKTVKSLKRTIKVSEK